MTLGDEETSTIPEPALTTIIELIKSKQCYKLDHLINYLKKQVQHDIVSMVEIPKALSIQSATTLSY